MSSCNVRNETMEDNYSFENFVKNFGKVFIIMPRFPFIISICSGKTHETELSLASFKHICLSKI